uniref:C3H1-type domain-containing protein n=3 Tax=Manihot esculenta TaxID=3983 RepID=A0A2C9U0H5_MANES
MRGLQRSKRVSWATDVNLCQVRLFLSEESPSQVGLGAQDHLQAKASWLSHPAGTTAEDALPPGFEGLSANQLHAKSSDIPVIKWRCPPRFILDLTWQVVAGEESEEVEVQNQREMRVLEAVYPRTSAIPQNSTFSADLGDYRHSDQVPLIPITPFEDEDATDAPSDLMGSFNVPMSSQSQLLASGIPPPQCSISSISNTPVNEKPASGAIPGVEPDVIAAASAAFAAINKSNEQGGLVDNDLLIKILNNPKLIEKLIQDYAGESNGQNIPKPNASFVPSSDVPPPPPTLSEPSYLHMNRTDTSTTSSHVANSSGSVYAQPNGIGPVYISNAQVPLAAAPAPASSGSAVGVPQVKDVNYYKNLIQQHGGERHESPHQYGGRYSHQVGTNQEVLNPKSRDSKPKIMKPCIYFNSSRGCRHGANCAYQHDASSQQRSSSISEVQTAKRMKMDREISS